MMYLPVELGSSFVNLDTSCLGYSRAAKRQDRDGVCRLQVLRLGISRVSKTLAM